MKNFIILEVGVRVVPESDASYSRRWNFFSILTSQLDTKIPNERYWLIYWHGFFVEENAREKGAVLPKKIQKNWYKNWKNEIIWKKNILITFTNIFAFFFLIGTVVMGGEELQKIMGSQLSRISILLPPSPSKKWPKKACLLVYLNMYWQSKH